VHRRCTVCAHPRLEWINQQVRSCSNWNALGKQLGLSRQALHRHAERHPLGEPVASQDVEPARLTGRRRRQRVTPIDDARAKGIFLGAFKTGGDFKGATEIAGVSRSTVQTWLEHDEAFSLRFHQAKAELVDHLEATAIERATQGGKLIRRVFRGGQLYEEIHEWRPSDAALIKLLTSLKPEIYGEKIAITQMSIVKAVDSEAWNAI